METTKTITGYRHKQGCSPRAGQGRAERGRADIRTDIYADFYFAAINFYAATTS